MDLLNIDRRIIYFFVFVSLAVPIIFGTALPAAEMKTAEDVYKSIEDLSSSDQIVLISADWGPNTLAENQPQTELILEHLMRKRIPFAIMTLYSLAGPFIERLPEQVAKKLTKENPNETWEYGKDWVNLGYRPGMVLMVQGMAKSEDLPTYLKADYQGTPLKQFPIMANVRTIKDISLVAEITGLSGLLQVWIQFFQSVPIIHGCTSISIPDTYNYYASKQVLGFFEGVAGAAYYEQLLSNNFKERETGSAVKLNTSLSSAQITILFFILVGNLAYLIQGRKK